MDSPFAVLTTITRALSKLDIAYVVVGSFASSMRGLYRATGDIDIVADIKANHVKPLVKALEESFYIDEQAVRSALIHHRSFNAIHFDSVFKVDIFIPPDSDFKKQQLSRRLLETISPEVVESIYVATAEDTILAKLKWYRAGGEVSNTHWRDVLGIIGTQGKDLDFEYLRDWAERLNELDLLEKAFSEVL